jgi:hypothetical protein
MTVDRCHRAVVCCLLHVGLDGSRIVQQLIWTGSISSMVQLLVLSMDSRVESSR